MKLFNGLKLRLVKITGLSFLSSMTTLSILNIADTSIAFPANVKNCENRLCLTTYYLPDGDSKSIAVEERFLGGTNVDILFCRFDGTWCYLQGYRPTSGKAILEPRWVRQNGLCSSLVPFLQSCSGNNSLQNVVDRQNSTRDFFCEDHKQPLLWFDNEITKSLCLNTETNIQIPER